MARLRIPSTLARVPPPTHPASAAVRARGPNAPTPAALAGTHSSACLSRTPATLAQCGAPARSALAQVGANVCLIGLYNAAALTAERSLFFLINEHYEKDLSALAVRCKQGGRRADVILNYLLSTSQVRRHHPAALSARPPQRMLESGRPPRFLKDSATLIARALFVTTDEPSASAHRRRRQHTCTAHHHRHSWHRPGPMPLTQRPHMEPAAPMRPRPTAPHLQTGVAPLYILFNALIAALLVWAPYTLLVEFSMLLSVPSIFLFMWSFVALRVQQPAVERPFRIPGGIATAVMITVVPIAISISYAAIISTEALIGRPGSRVDKQPLDEDGPEERQPAYQIYSMIGVISFGLLVHAIGGRCTRRALPQVVRAPWRPFRASERVQRINGPDIAEPRPARTGLRSVQTAGRAPR